MTGLLETSKQIDPVYMIDLTLTLKNKDPFEVISVFDILLDKNKPQNAMALTSSPILGKAWRLICGQYKFMLDGKYEKACQTIMDKLSTCKELLGDSDKNTLKDWIDLSYDETPQIRKDVSKAIPDSTTFLRLPEEFRGSVSLDDVLELGRGGGKFNELGQLIVSLKVDDKTNCVMPADEYVAPDFIPIEGMRSQTMFSLIANLLSPGLRFSKTVSMMAAILALPNKYLGHIASKYLEDRKGNWVDWELKEDGSQKFPVFWSLNFMRLLKLCPDEFLTQHEINFRDNYLQISKIIKNHNAELEVTVPTIISGIRSDITWKRYCDPAKDGCGHSRCFSI